MATLFPFCKQKVVVVLEATVPGCSLAGEPEGWGRKREGGGRVGAPTKR